jgi:hypothetical protein
MKSDVLQLPTSTDNILSVGTFLPQIIQQWNCHFLEWPQKIRTPAAHFKKKLLT